MHRLGKLNAYNCNVMGLFVVIVEPQQLIDDADGAVGDLYVSMTRPTQRLHMVGSRMPAGL